mgnify:CR=1 FL=1
MEKLRKQLDISIPAKSAVDFALKVVADKVLKERKKREKKNDAKALLTQDDMAEVKKVGRPRKVLAKLR